MTYKSLLKKAEKRIESTELETEAAKWLLMHVSELSPSQFYLAFDKEVKPEIEKAFNEGIDRYLSYVPIQHIIGYQTFYGYDFIVNEDVLIPRRETEELVEQVLYYYDDHFKGQKIDVCDIGTGSGCIAITLAKEEPNLNVVASDISNKALEVAKKNNQKLGAKVVFYEGDLLSPLKGMTFDIIVSNPPYIPNQEDVAKIVKTHEPNIALFGGDSGLIFYERILKDAKYYLKDKGLIAFEHAYDKKEALFDLIKHYYKDANVIQLKDLSGKDRMTLIEVMKMMPDDYTFEDGFMPDGSIVIFPTDTTFGIACRLYDNEAFNRISQLKNNDKFNYAVLCDTLVSINDLAFIDERAKKLMLAFWPGALTIILKSSKPHYEKTGDKKIAVTIPNHNGALSLIKKNGPLVTTSLSSEDQDLLMDLNKIKMNFQDKVDFIYEEYNNFYLNMGSTTIDLSENEIKYIRIGSITETEIKAVIEDTNYHI